MQKTKIEEYPVPPSVEESIAEGLPEIDGFPSPGCRFVLDRSFEAYEHWPLAMGCIENDAGVARTALVAISKEVAIIKERNRARSTLYRFIGKRCLDVTVTATTATVFYL